jgi:hypothetical protein
MLRQGWSWGVRGFRVGVSPNGRKWIAITLPFGFRYFTYLPSIKQRGLPRELDPEFQEGFEPTANEQRIKWKDLPPRQ